MFQRGILLAIKRTPVLLSYNVGIVCKNTKHLTIPMAAICAAHITARADYSTTTSKALVVQKPHKKPGFIVKFLRSLNLVDSKKYRSLNLGFILYEKTVDDLDYMKFFKAFDMEDTMFSWYLITQLHVWMLTVRYMVDSKYGYYVRNSAIEAMWNDMEIRIQKLGKLRASVRRKQIEHCAAHLKAVMLEYDEALLSDDAILANALWEIFFCQNCNNPLHLELLLVYVRKTLHMLDMIPSDHLWMYETLPWLDLDKVGKAEELY